jgi:CRISPR-associated endonuclease Csn1
MKQRTENFKSVVKKLEEAFEGKGIHITPGIIRKARIAEDLGWKCPYTDALPYDAFNLLHGKVDKDHIIPRRDRASDSLDSLAITFAEVNKMKSGRTAYRFIEQEQGKEVPGLPGVHVKSLDDYVRDVAALSPLRDPRKDSFFKKNHIRIDDALRCWLRKKKLELRDYVDKEFTPGDLTQTSQLARLGAQTLQKHYAGAAKQPVITSLPGAVTGAVRRSWNLIGCLAAANRQVLDPADLDEGGRPKVRTKTEIRAITHLHHALDACVLVLASQFLRREGSAWALLLKRRLNAGEQSHARSFFGSQIEITKEGEPRIADLPPALKAQICGRLKECRVVQHLPADLSGMDCKETVWRLFDEKDLHPNALRLARWLDQKKVAVPPPDASTALIICRKRHNAEATASDGAGGKVLRETKTWQWVYDIKDKTALLGFAPDGSPTAAKLKRIKAVKVFGDNFGLALDPNPTMIRPHKVWHRLEALRKTNRGIPTRVVRKGTLIRVATAKSAKVDYRGVWMVRGTTINQRAGFLVDLSPPDQITYRRQPGCYENVSLTTLLKCGMEVLKSPLCGVMRSLEPAARKIPQAAACPTTSSA